MPGITIDPAKVLTNIAIFGVQGTGHTAAEICAALAERNILASPTEKFFIRMVTHYDVDEAGIDRALAAIKLVLATSSSWNLVMFRSISTSPIFWLSLKISRASLVK